MNEKDFKTLISQGEGGGFLLCGDEPYLKRNCLEKLRASVCDEVFAVFNHIKITAENYSPESLRDAIAAPPMMGDKKLIELEELDLNNMRAKELESLCSTLQILPKYEYTLLVLNAEDDFDIGMLPKKPSACYKQLCSVLTPVIFEKATESQLKSWIARHFKSSGIAISSESAAELVSYCGRGMENLAGEIEKLTAYVLYDKRDTVSVADIHKVCSRSEESDAFAMVDAILDRRTNAAFDALADMKRRRVDPIAVLGAVSRVYAELLSVKTMLDRGKTPSEIATAMKMHEYRAKLYCKSASPLKLQYLRLAAKYCLEADLELKNGTPGYLPIEKLICRCAMRDA
jgi:DNA polymerase III delta subunit